MSNTEITIVAHIERRFTSQDHLYLHVAFPVGACMDSARTQRPALAQQLLTDRVLKHDQEVISRVMSFDQTDDASDPLIILYRFDRGSITSSLRNGEQELIVVIPELPLRDGDTLLKVLKEVRDHAQTQVREAIDFYNRVTSAQKIFVACGGLK